MAIVVTQGLSGKHFSANLPNLAFSISGAKARVQFVLGTTELYDEILYPANGLIEVLDIASMVEPYVKQVIVGTLTTTITEMSVEGNTLATNSQSCTVVYSTADVDIPCEAFCSAYFLSLLQGEKVTGMGRLEYLHYHGSETASATAHYSDGTSNLIAATIVSGNANIKTIDVSPYRFAVSGKTLVEYVVACGSREQRYVIDHTLPDAAPILIFENSFGCEELIYCTGEHKVNPKYERSSARIRGKKKNYRIDETRAFEANTGFLNTAMANWADDLFRSEFVRVLNVYEYEDKTNGEILRDVQIGKEIVITESKSDNSNLDNYMPAFTFTYQYAQRNHNVIQTQRAGRIFDNTFDNTFN